MRLRIIILIVDESLSITNNILKNEKHKVNCDDFARCYFDCTGAGLSLNRP